MRNIAISLFHLLAFFSCYSSTLLGANFFPLTVPDLIASINAANVNVQDDVIDLGNLVFNLTAADNATDGANGLPSILGDTGHELLIQNGTINRSAGIIRLIHLSGAASLSLNNVTLSNGIANTAGLGSFGGAIFVSNTATLELISNTTFTTNTSTAAGGAIGLDTAATIGSITLSLFTGNSSGAAGGAISVVTGGSIVSIDNSTFADNQAAAAGGAISLTTGCSIGTISDSTFSGNSAIAAGGGISVLTTSTITAIINSTFSGNTAGTNGGGIDVTTTGNIQKITNSTFTDNTATLVGGGINLLTTSTITTLTSTIIANNSALSGPDVGDPTLTGIIAESFNLIGINTNSGLVAGNPNANNSKVGTAASPINPGLGPLANNGGPTQTHEIFITSPAFESGANPDALAFDQRGAGFLRVTGSQADIGAFELQCAFGDYDLD
jgi:predicted outer membrane repeat protein